MKVLAEKCVGCGLCVKDCFPRDIEIIDGKATIKNETCMKCGHCIAVCPRGAVINENDTSEVLEYNKESFHVDPDNLLNFIKYRRTVRQFRDKKIEREKINQIIEAGRYTQTGSNLQDVSYIVVEEQLDTLKELTFATLKVIGQEMLDNLNAETSHFKRYANLWIQMSEKYEENKKDNDKLFFNAPAIIVVSAYSDVNAALASSNMELMTDALGLGTFFSGFFVMAANKNPKIQELLGIKKGKKIATCMVLGYPDVKYYRTVPRKEADVKFI